MSAYINFAALSVEEIRSDALGPLDSVAHPLDLGSYRGIVLRNKAQIGSFEIEVVEGEEGDQLEIDFARIEAGGESLRFLASAPAGEKVYAVFHCDGEGKGYSVLLYNGTRGELCFDSRKLGKKDYFIFTPVRPGDYAMKCLRRTGVTGTLSVHQAEPTEQARASSLGATLRITDRGFEPTDLRVRSGDGVVVEIDADDVAFVAQLNKEGREKRRRPDVPIRYAGRNILDAGAGKIVKKK